MAKSNMFDEAVEQREKEQAQVTAVVNGNAPKKTNRTMLNINYGMNAKFMKLCKPVNH